MIDLEDWKRQLATPGARVELDGGEGVIQEPITLTADDVKCDSITIRNTEFINSLTLDGCQLEGPFSLESCSAQDITIVRCNFKGDILTLTGLMLEDCKVHNWLSVKNCKFKYGGIKITGGAYADIVLSDIQAESAKIEMVNFSCININIGTVTTSELNLYRLSVPDRPDAINSSYTVSRCSLSRFHLSQNKLAAMTIERMEAAEYADIHLCSFDRFFFRHPASSVELVLRSSEFKSVMSISIPHYLRIDNRPAKMKAIRLIDCDLGKNAQISGGIGKDELDELALMGTKTTDSVLEVLNLHIHKARIEYDRTIHSLFFRNIEFEIIQMNHFRNSGQLLFSSVYPSGPDATWQIIGAQPGQWQLIDCNLQRLDLFEVKNSDISGLRYASVEWFPRKALYPFELRDEKNSGRLKKHVKIRPWEKISRDHPHAVEARNRREIYRMLKEAAENQKDRIRALRFQQEEMVAHARYLKLTRNFWHPDRIVLWAGKSNNHGLNWWKPALLAIGCSIPFYILIVIGGERDLSLSAWRDTGSFLWKDIGLFPQLLNPVHSLDKMFDPAAAIHPLTWWLDYLHRLLMAFFIVQTVSAFRKFMRA